MPSDLDKLRELLVGNTIEAVESPDPGISEALCKITVRKDGEPHEFHLHATDLGWWIGEHKSLRDDGQGNLTPCWESFDLMIEAVCDHLTSEAMDDWDQEGSPLVAQDDVLTRSTGFRCKHTGQEWWVAFQAAKAFSNRNPDLWNTTAVRAQVATFLGLQHRLPRSVTELTA